MGKAAPRDGSKAILAPQTAGQTVDRDLIHELLDRQHRCGERRIQDHAPRELARLGRHDQLPGGEHRAHACLEPLVGVGQVGGAEPEDLADAPPLLPELLAFGGSEGAHVALVGPVRGIDEGLQDPPQERGIITPERRAGRNGPTLSRVRPRTRACIEPTISCTSRAWRSVPKMTVLTARAVRARRGWGCSIEALDRKNPSKATGCAACRKSARAPDSATVRSRCTARISDPSGR